MKGPRDRQKYERSREKTSRASRIRDIHDLILMGITADSESRTNDVNKALQAMKEALRNGSLARDLISQHGGSVREAQRRITLRIDQLRTVLTSCSSREQDTLYAVISLLKYARRRIR